MVHTEADGIRELVDSRGIKSLVHFTKVANIPEILNHGLLGRETLAVRGINTQINDQHRLDHVPDAVCTSISFPNYKTFYGLQRSDPQTDWAVLRISPAVLWELPCAFCVSNAASIDVSGISLEQRKGLAALASMFGDFSPETKRAELGIPGCYTTNPQAEVLILAPVAVSYIASVNVNSERKINDFDGIKKLFRPYAGKMKFCHDQSLFTYRKDYEHWRPTVEKFNDIGIDFSKFFKF